MEKLAVVKCNFCVHRDSCEIIHGLEKTASAIMDYETRIRECLNFKKEGEDKNGN